MRNSFALLVVLLLEATATSRAQGPAEVKTAFPQVLTCVRASYTPEARAAKIQGWVNVSAVVRPDGTVDDAKVSETCLGHIGATVDDDWARFGCNRAAESGPSLTAPHRALIVALEAEAMEAARQWVFRPATKGGRSVSTGITIQIDFDPREVPGEQSGAQRDTQPNQRLQPSARGGILCTPRLNRGR